jgi:hypothetical protein
MKYKIGDKVKVKGQGEEHEILGIIVDASGIVYKVSSKEVDVQAKEIVNGVSFFKEEELGGAK